MRPNPRPFLEEPVWLSAPFTLFPSKSIKIHKALYSQCTLPSELGDTEAAAREDEIRNWTFKINGNG